MSDGVDAALEVSGGESEKDVREPRLTQASKAVLEPFEASMTTAATAKQSEGLPAMTRIDSSKVATTPGKRNSSPGEDRPDHAVHGPAM